MSVDLTDLAMLSDWVEERDGPGKIVREAVEELRWAREELKAVKGLKERCTSIQAHFEDMMYHNSGDAIRRCTLRAIRETEHDVVLLNPPSVNFYENVNLEEVTSRQVHLVRFNYSLHFGPRTPPELFAKRLADQFRESILEHWQHQSILNKKT